MGWFDGEQRRRAVYLFGEGKQHVDRAISVGSKIVDEKRGPFTTADDRSSRQRNRDTHFQWWTFDVEVSQRFENSNTIGYFIVPFVYWQMAWEDRFTRTLVLSFVFNKSSKSANLESTRTQLETKKEIKPDYSLIVARIWRTIRERPS